VTVQKLLSYIRDVAAIAVLALAGLLLWNLDRATLQANALIANTNDAMAHFKAASVSLENAAASEQSYLARASQELAKTVADAHDILIHTDISLNGTREHPGLVPQLSAAVTAQSASALETQAQLRSSMAAVTGLSSTLETAVVNLNQATANVARLSADPGIPAAIADLASSSKNLASTTAEANGTMQDVHKAIDWEIAQLEKPVSKIKAAGEETVSLLGRFFGFH
jgi:ABC-type transporter Mla subunit MlaD